MQEQPKLDWVNLPPNAVVESLWDCLHDGDLLAVRADLLVRTVTLEIDVAHVRDFHKIGDDTHFLVTLHDVQSVRAATFAVWPGPRPDTSGKSREEESRLINEYQAKWREESVGWNDFMALFPANKFDISNAEIVRGESGVAMQIGGMVDGDDIADQFFTIFLRAEAVSLQQSDGVSLTVEQLIKLGEDYWNAWSARATERQNETG